MKKGLDFSIVKKLPVDELNENFQPWVTKPKNLDIITNRSNSVVVKNSSYLSSRFKTSESSVNLARLEMIRMMEK